MLVDVVYCCFYAEVAQAAAEMCSKSEFNIGTEMPGSEGIVVDAGRQEKELRLVLHVRLINETWTSPGRRQ